jgi:hypothetical protein
MPDRVFTEEEVKEIVRRASEQQAEDAERREARRHGLTLDDLERLGAEVGLDPVYLRRAADEVKTGRRAVTETETQTDTHVIVERRIDRPFTPEAWEDTVALLRNQFPGESRVEQVGHAQEWLYTNPMGTGTTRVSATDRDGQTRLILSQQVGSVSPKRGSIGYGVALGLALGVIGGIPVANTLDSIWAFLLVWLVVTLVTALLASPIIRRWGDRWREGKMQKLKDLATDIEQVFEEVTPRSTEQAASSNAALPAESKSESAERIDLDAVPESEDGATSAERNRVRS